MQQSRLSGFLVVLLAVGTSDAMAQARFDSITTPRGKCAVWASIPGFSNGNEAINRCALDSGLVLLTPVLPLPAPRVEQTAHGSYTIVVNTDGAVDNALTRAWTLTGDNAWNQRTMETIRQWRFQPGVRNGVPVRSAFKLAIRSGSRNDTVASRLEWKWQPGFAEDSLIGTWVVEAKPAPFRSDQVDNVHLALLRHLVATKVVQPGLLSPPYCLVMGNGDSTAHRRLSMEAHGILYNNSHTQFLAPYGCERRPNSVRILLPHVYRTENDRAVLYTAGDYLKDWPVGFDEKTYRAWDGRCVADVPEAGPVRMDCMILPDYVADPEFTLRVLRERAERAEATGRDTAPQLTVVAMTRGAYQKDTVRVRLGALPRVSERAVRDSVPDCGSMTWGAYTQQDSGALYIVKAEFEKLDARTWVHVTAVGAGRSPTSFRGGRCNTPNPRQKTLLAFALGDVGEPLRQPVTLCIQERGCSRSFAIDPARHTLFEQAQLRFKISDLRPDTRTGKQLVFRIYTNRRIQGQVPLVVVRAKQHWMAWIPREINAQEWESGTIFTEDYPTDAEIRVYLLIFD